MLCVGQKRYPCGARLLFVDASHYKNDTLCNLGWRGV